MSGRLATAYDCRSSVTYRLVIFQAILILIRLFTADDGASVRLRFIIGHQAKCVWNAGQYLLVSNALCDLAVGAILGPSQSKLRMLLRTIKASVRTEQSLCGLVDAKVKHVISATKAWKLLLAGHEGIVLHGHVPEAANDGILELPRRSRRMRKW